MVSIYLLFKKKKKEKSFLMRTAHVCDYRDKYLGYLPSIIFLLYFLYISFWLTPILSSSSLQYYLHSQDTEPTYI